MSQERPRNDDGELDDDFEVVEQDDELDLDDLIELDELEDLESDIPDLLAQAPAEPATGSLEAFVGGQVQAPDVVALSDLGKVAARRFAGEWPALPVEARRLITFMMGDLPHERYELRFGRALRVALTDEDAVVRQLAITGLWNEEDEACIAILLDLIEQDDSIDVRAEAARAIGEYVSLAEIEEIEEAVAEDMRERLLALVSDPDTEPMVRRRVLESAAVYGGAEIESLIQDAYDTGEHDEIASALFAMGRTCDKRWLPPLIEELASDDAQLRFEAARSLGEIGSDRAVADLLAAMDGEEDVEVRHAVIGALGEIGGKSAKRALQRLAELAEDVDREVIEDALEMSSFDDSGPDL
ncbi:MAG: HEAT repeat domain-containing protein [Thermomicrobiales bacterium]